MGNDEPIPTYFSFPLLSQTQSTGDKNRFRRSLMEVCIGSKFISVIVSKFSMICFNMQSGPLGLRKPWCFSISGIAPETQKELQLSQAIQAQELTK